MGRTMDKLFVILLGVIVAALYVPPIVMPARSRELAHKIMTTPSILRRFGFAMVAVGILAMLLGNNSDLHHRILLMGGFVETLAGLIMLIRPVYFVSQMQLVFSKSLKVWVTRGLLKFAFGVAIVLWGVTCF